MENQQRIIMETIVGQLDFHGQDVEEHILQETEEEERARVATTRSQEAGFTGLFFCID